MRLSAPARPDRPLTVPWGSVPSVAVVGTHPPTVCGLATYTANLRRALASALPTVDVVRVAGDDDVHHPDVADTWNRDDVHGVEPAASTAAAYDVVVLQHEYGIYPGPDGAWVLAFVARCNSPVVSVLHTVVESPSQSQRQIIDALGRLSAMVVVHSAVASARLLGTHAIDPSRVAVIPHGATHDPDGLPDGRTGPPVVLTWGLLGPGKGIELAIDAIARLRERGLDLRYVVAGPTHPTVLARDGEQYRETLVERAIDRGVDDLVEFDGTYRDDRSLRQLVRSASAVLLPYESRDQVTSGVLVEALAAGRPVVATGFPHAVELSRSGAVRVFRHGAVDGCASALDSVLGRPEVRQAMARAAAREGARHDWGEVARRYRNLILAVHSSNLAATRV